MLRTDGHRYAAAPALRRRQTVVPYAIGRLAVAMATVRLWLHRRRTRRQLALLDDRRLRDIGLTRQDARRESALPFWAR